MFIYYKLDNFTGNMGKAELRVVRHEIETDTGSTEREHSHNQRRARFRVWTHAQPISNLSCFFTSHKCGEWKWQESDALRKQCMLTDKPKEHVTKRFSWAWKAFLHCHGRGAFMSPEKLRQLSADFSVLSDDDKGFYEEVGDLAFQARCSGAKKPFSVIPPVFKHRIVCAPAAQPAIVDATSSCVAIPCSADSRASGNAIHSIVRAATQERQNHRRTVVVCV